LANPSSGRVLVIFSPYQFEPGEIGQLIFAVVSQSLSQAANDSDEHETVAATPFRSRQQKLAQQAQSNELYQLIKHAEIDSKLRNKAVRLSVVHAGFKLLSPFTISLMVSSLFFPFASLTQMGLGKGLQLALFGSLFGASRVGESVASHQKSKAWSLYANEIDKILVKQTFAHVQSLDMAYLEGQNTEKLMNVISADTNVIKRFLIFAPQEMTEKLTTIAIGSAGILALAPGAFLLCLLPIPIITRLNKRQQQATKDRYQQGATLDGQYNQILSSNLNGLSTVKSFTAEQQEIDRLCKAKNRATDNTIELDKQNSYYNNTGEFTFVVGIINP
ncbi:MAG: ABC transporter transmembrane domain-containing protein, partial [Psychrosphaera sp.]|nr:ABC transporter transmembrane domain-containing protein [Psychrosphaera sp.]